MYDSQLCSIARTLEVVGERWTLLIIRDAQLGLRRFEEFQDSLGIARNVLTNRLSKLVDDGLLERVCYQERPARYEYRPTDKARDLLTALLPRFASESHKDGRAPQNLYPIGGLEKHLRHRLGDRELVIRALRVAAVA